MRMRTLFAALALTSPALAGNTQQNPTWWGKFTYISHNGPDAFSAATLSASTETNVDVSNECRPQSETFIAINPRKSSQLATGSNEIFRLPMRGYFSSDDGKSWGGVDLPLPPPIGTNGVDFGSDPTLAFDSSNNLFYGYIVVFFGAAFNTPGFGVSINGTEMGGALDRRRQDLAAGYVLRVQRRREPLQRQADDH